MPVKAEPNCRLVKGQVFLWPYAKGLQSLILRSRKHGKL